MYMYISLHTFLTSSMYSWKPRTSLYTTRQSITVIQSLQLTQVIGRKQKRYRILFSLHSVKQEYLQHVQCACALFPCYACCHSNQKPCVHFALVWIKEAEKRFTARNLHIPYSSNTHTMFVCVYSSCFTRLLIH